MSAISDLTNRTVVLAKEIENTKTQALNDDASWFQDPPLRKSIYDRLYFDTYISSIYSGCKNQLVNRTVNYIWQSCNESAAMIFTRIAPPQSYQGKENDIIRATIELPSFTQEPGITKAINATTIKKGIDLFKQILSQPLEKAEKRAFICNLYCGTHVFVVEQSSDKCTIFQSYEKSYTLDEYLKDSSKIVSLNPEKLIKKSLKF